MPNQILPEENISTQFLREIKPIWVDIVVVTQILMVAKDAIDATLRLEGRYDVKERVEYFIGGPVKIHVNMGPGNLQQDVN